MEVLKNIWNWVLPIGGGATVGAILLAIFIPLIKAGVAKMFEKINIDGAIKKQSDAIDGAVNKAVERVQGVSFTHSIQPLVESELMKVGEAANEQIKTQISEMHKENAALLAVLKAQAAYFDDSIVSDEKKAALHNAIDTAEKIFVTPLAESTAEIAEVETEEVKAKKTHKKAEVIR